MICFSLRTCTLDYHGVSSDGSVSVQPLQGKQDGDRDEPLPEGRVVVVHAVQEEKYVDQTRCHPVDEVEGDEAKSFPDEGDAAKGHDHDNAEDHKAGYGGEDVVFDCAPEVLRG